MPLASPRNTTPCRAPEVRAPSPRSGKRTIGGSQSARKRTYGTAKSASRTTTLSAVDEEGAITKIQSVWRRMTTNRHVFLLQLVLFETRQFLDARREREEEEGSAPLKPIERLRETAQAVMHSVRKCVMAFKATEFMRKDRLKAERVAKLKNRFQAAQRTVRNLTKLRGGLASKRAKEVDERLAWIDSKLKNSKEAYKFDKAARKIQKVWTERSMRRLQEANERWARLYNTSRVSSRRSSRRSSQNSNVGAGHYLTAPEEDLKIVVVAANHALEAAGGRRSVTPLSLEHAGSPEPLPAAVPLQGPATPPPIPLPAAGSGRCGSPGPSEFGEDAGVENFGDDSGAISPASRQKFELLQARLDRLESLEVAEAALEKRDVKKKVVNIFAKMLGRVSLNAPVDATPTLARRFRSMGSWAPGSTLAALMVPDAAFAKRATLADASPSALLGAGKRRRPTPLMPLPTLGQKAEGDKQSGEAAAARSVHAAPGQLEAPAEGADNPLDALARHLPPLLSRRGMSRLQPSPRASSSRARPRASVGAHGGFLIRVPLQPPASLASPASPASPSSAPRPPSPRAAAPAGAATAGRATPQTGAQPAPAELPETPLGLSLGVAAAAGAESGDWQLVVLGIGLGPVQDHAMQKGIVYRLRRGDRLLSVDGATDLGEMLSRLTDAKGPEVPEVLLEVELRTTKEANEAAEAAVPIEPGDRLLGPASAGAAGGAGGAEGSQAPALFAGLERAATLALLPEPPLAGPFEAAEAEAFSRVPTWERHKILAAQRPRRAHQVPQWLSQSLFAPLLRESICALGAGDALELLLRLDSSTGWSARSEAHATVRHELHAAVVASGPNGMGGGPGLWAALEVGLSGGTAHGSSAVLLPDLDPRLWCEVLFHFGALALQRERDRLADLQDEWTLGSVRSGWKARLEGLDEALGWCAQSLDVLQEVHEFAGPLGGPAAASGAAAAGAAAGAGAHGPGSTWADVMPAVKPSSRHVVLEREVRRAVREVEIQRWQEAQSVSQVSELSDVPVAKRGLEHLQAVKARRIELEAQRREANAGPLSFHVWKESSAGRCAASAAELRKAGGTWLAPGAFPAAPPVPLPATGRPQAGAGRFRSRRVCAVAPARGLVVA